MQNYALSVIVFALIIYRWFPITNDNLLILVESKTEEVNFIRQISGLISAFKIETSLKTYWKEDHTENDMKVNIT